MTAPAQDPIVAFYGGVGPDGAGRTIETVWGFDAVDLEHHHDFIQWLFPLAVPSRVNPGAPVATRETAAAFQASPELRARLLRSLDLMLAFYGFERSAEAVNRAPTFEARAATWASPGNHNHLRLSRMVQSLALLGLEPEAKALSHALLDTARDLGSTGVSRQTVAVWENLLTR